MSSLESRVLFCTRISSIISGTIDNINYKSLLKEAAKIRNLEIKVQRFEKEFVYSSYIRKHIHNQGQLSWHHSDCCSHD